VPTWPAKVTRLPRRVLPDTPTCDTITQFSPVTTLCASITRLSTLVPRPMRVSLKRARSTVELAPISTSSSSTHAPELRES
jgi:hypothetical protein